MRAPARLFCLILLVAASQAFAADFAFTGSLIRVTRQTIAIKRPGGVSIHAWLPDQGSLSAESIATKYKAGDQVEITCSRMPLTFDDETAAFYSLQVAGIRLVRTPSPEESATILPLPGWHGFGNLLTFPEGVPVPFVPTPAAAGDPALLDHVRQVNLEYTRALPNFVADEVAKRYRQLPRSSRLEYVDRIESEMTFRGGRGARRQVLRDGQPQRFETILGFRWYGGFGSEIRSVLDPICPTSLVFAGRIQARGKPALVYRYSSPPDGCFGEFFADYENYSPARSGRIVVEESSGRVIQLEEKATGFPSGFLFTERDKQIEWDDVKIGDTTHLLPVSAEFVARYKAGAVWRVSLEFKNHRHFEASSTVTYR